MAGAGEYPNDLNPFSKGDYHSLLRFKEIPKENKQEIVKEQKPVKKVSTIRKIL